MSRVGRTVADGRDCGTLCFWTREGRVDGVLRLGDSVFWVRDGRVLGREGVWRDGRTLGRDGV